MMQFSIMECPLFRRWDFGQRWQFAFHDRRLVIHDALSFFALFRMHRLLSSNIT